VKPLVLSFACLFFLSSAFAQAANIIFPCQNALAELNPLIADLESLEVKLFEELDGLGPEILRTLVCGRASGFLSCALRERGFTVSRHITEDLRRTVVPARSYVSRHHVFPVVVLPSGREIIVDAAFQSFYEYALGRQAPGAILVYPHDELENWLNEIVRIRRASPLHSYSRDLGIEKHDGDDVVRDYFRAVWDFKHARYRRIDF
jgi:hypothetical protein